MNERSNPTGFGLDEIDPDNSAFLRFMIEQALRNIELALNNPNPATDKAELLEQKQSLENRLRRLRP